MSISSALLFIPPQSSPEKLVGSMNAHSLYPASARDSPTMQHKYISGDEESAVVTVQDTYYSHDGMIASLRTAMTK